MSDNGEKREDTYEGKSYARMIRSRRRNLPLKLSRFRNCNTKKLFMAASTNSSSFLITIHHFHKPKQNY
ncbi:unnamed protein product [Lathyrus sativus]|nr:unnamed protein product [Lathyrus sativus]